MNVFSLSGFLLGITCFFLGLVILRFSTNGVHLTFAFQNLAISVWGFGCGFAGIAQDPNTALFWWKIAHIGPLFLIVFLLHHVLLLAGKAKKTLLISLYIIASSLPTLFFLNLIGIRLRYKFNSFYFPEPTNFVYPLYCLIWVLTAIYISFLILQVYKNSPEKKKISLKLYSVAYLSGMWGGASYFLPVFNVNIYPYGNFLIPLYCILMFYSIFRHKLLDIEIIVKRTLVFAGLLISVFTMLVLPTLLIQEYILRQASVSARLIGLTISGIVIILTMRRIETFLISVTDKYLFQRKYDYKSLLKTFTSDVLTVLNLEQLLNLTADKLTDIMKLDSCAVLLFIDETQQFNVKASRNINDPNVFLLKSDSISEFMSETRTYILKKEMNQKNISMPPSVLSVMNKLNAELLVPMLLHEKLIGILSLGKKKSDEDYQQDDVDILVSLSRTLAIAISNAQLFDELGKTQAEAAQKEKMAVIGTLSAGINHEICNPLGIARGQCEAFLLNLKDGLYKAKTTEELLDKAKEIMSKVIKETDRATAITKKLSGFAKPAKGEAELVNINKEVDEVIGLVGYELKLEKIEVAKEIPLDIPNITVDKKQFQEVLFNLIRNAGQAIGEKGKITVIAKEENSRVYIDIQDTGSGISENKIKELFNPFFTTKEPGKGTGLGLFIVRQVVEKNGGKIYLKQTKVGEGTTFTIEFPVVVAQEAEVRHG